MRKQARQTDTRHKASLIQSIDLLSRLGDMRDDSAQVLLSPVFFSLSLSLSLSLSPEEAPVDPQGSWSCSAPSCWSLAPSRRCSGASSGASSRKPGFFFSSSQSHLAGSMFTAVQENRNDKFTFFSLPS